MDSANRVMLNTSAQFIKTFVSGIITLYSSRIILLSLGENDFGIYSLVAGIILMLSFITNALSATTQRFLSYHQLNPELKKYFTNSVILHVIVGLLVAVIFISLIPLLFSGFLNISPDRIGAAKFVYITVIISVLISFVTAPYKAVLIAHENIIYVSIIDTIDAVLKLLIAISLDCITYDRLEYYGTLLAAIQLVNFLCFSLYSHKHFKECVLPRTKYMSKDIIKRLTSFAGWNMYCLGCNIGRTQGLSIVLNKFLGTVANAAYGIGLQISSYINYMSESLLNAIRPQIVKAEGNKNRERMFNLSMIASKYSFFLLSWLSIPCIFEMQKLLEIWLKIPPENSTLFCRMFLLAGLVDSITIGLHIANQAIGNLKNFVLPINTLKLIVLPISIIILLLGLDIIWVASTYVFFEFITSILRLYLIKKDGLNVNDYIKNVFIKIALPLLLCLFINYLSVNYIQSSFRIIWTFVLSFTIYGISIYLMGMSNKERQKFNSLLIKVRSKIL